MGGWYTPRMATVSAVTTIGQSLSVWINSMWRTDGIGQMFTDCTMISNVLTIAPGFDRLDLSAWCPMD